MLLEVMEPLITAQLRHADVIIISKTDTALAGEVERAEKTAREINEKAEVIPSGEEGNWDAVTAALLP
jgi:G3E family GTPase